MTDNSKALKPYLDLRRAGGLYNLLDSDNEGERRNAFKKLSDILRKTGVTFAEFRQLGRSENNNDDFAKMFAAMFQKDVDVLVKIAQQRGSFFCNDAVHAVVMVRGHRTTYPVESKGYANFLRHQFFEETELVPVGRTKIPRR